MIAASLPETSLVEYLLRKNADVHAKSKGKSSQDSGHANKDPRKDFNGQVIA